MSGEEVRCFLCPLSLFSGPIMKELGVHVLRERRSETHCINFKLKTLEN